MGHRIPFVHLRCGHHLPSHQQRLQGIKGKGQQDKAGRHGEPAAADDDLEGHGDDVQNELNKVQRPIWTRKGRHQSPHKDPQKSLQSTCGVLKSLAVATSTTTATTAAFLAIGRTKSRELSASFMRVRPSSTWKGCSWADCRTSAAVRGSFDPIQSDYGD